MVLPKITEIDEEELRPKDLGGVEDWIVADMKSKKKKKRH